MFRNSSPAKRYDLKSLNCSCGVLVGWVWVLLVFFNTTQPLLVLSSGKGFARSAVFCLCKSQRPLERVEMFKHEVSNSAR